MKTAAWRGQGHGHGITAEAQTRRPQGPRLATTQRGWGCRLHSWAWSPEPHAPPCREVRRHQGGSDSGKTSPTQNSESTEKTTIKYLPGAAGPQVQRHKVFPKLSRQVSVCLLCAGHRGRPWGSRRDEAWTTRRVVGREGRAGPQADTGQRKSSRSYKSGEDCGR